jgi:hypothetical protein
MSRALRLVTELSFALSLLMALGTSHAQTLPPEVLVTKAAIPDFEFDWGRNGTLCASCNFGSGNARFAFSDTSNKLWLGYVDHQTGAFYPPDGHGVLLDTGASAATDFGNGPEWIVTPEGSAVMYTKYDMSKPKTAANAGIALAKQINGAWSAGWLPNPMQRQSPDGTKNFDDADVRFSYFDQRTNLVYWRSLLSPDVERSLPISDGRKGIARRWVAGTRQVIYATQALGSDGVLRDQIFLYDTDTNQKEQLTFEPSSKLGAFMWRAPEFGNDWVFFTVADRTKLLVYRKLPDAKGVKRWTVIKTVNTPAQVPYIWSPEQFTHNGKSYVFFQLSSSSVFNDTSVPNQLAITGIDPMRMSFRMLTNDPATPRVRIDPEYYITARGPYIYYTRIIPSNATRPPANDGVWRVDTGLGPPLASTKAATVPGTGS